MHHYPFIIICVCLCDSVWRYEVKNSNDKHANRHILFYGQMSRCMCVYKHPSVGTTCNRITLSVQRKLDLSYSPPSLGGEGISGAMRVKGQAKLSPRLGGRVGLAGYSQHPPRALSHSHQLVFPVSCRKDDVVQDCPMDHLSISLAPFSSIQSSSRV